jgi:hypothetical protein
MTVLESYYEASHQHNIREQDRVDLMSFLPEGFCLLKPDDYLHPNRARQEQSFTHAMSKVERSQQASRSGSIPSHLQNLLVVATLEDDLEVIILLVALDGASVVVIFLVSLEDVLKSQVSKIRCEKRCGIPELTLGERNGSGLGIDHGENRFL